MEAADRAEHYATLAHDRIEHADARAEMYDLARAVRRERGLATLLRTALNGALTLHGSDLGVIQFASRSDGGLRIVCQQGFGHAFLRHFAFVDGEETSWGRAAKHHAQTVIADVDSDPAFAPHRAIAAISGFRSVQSTPLIDTSGRMLGVLSVHFAGAHRPDAHEMRMAETYARLVADAIAATVEAA